MNLRVKQKTRYADISLIGMGYIYILLQFLSTVSPLCLCSFIVRKYFQQKFVTFQTSTWVLQFNQYAIYLIPKFIFILSEMTHILVTKGLNFEQNFRDFFFFNLIQPTIPPYFRLGQKILPSKIHQITAETERKNFTEICDYHSYSFQYFVGKLSISDCLYKFFYQVSMLFRAEGII